MFENHFWDFYESQNKKVQKKIDWTIGLVRDLKVIPKTYFTHLTGTEGLWEIRVKVGSDIFRIFCCFDDGNLVILFSGFQKKTQKTPKGELAKAVRLKKKYFDGKSE